MSGAHSRTRTEWPMWTYSISQSLAFLPKARKVQQVTPRAQGWPNQRTDFLPFNFKRQWHCWELTTSHASLCPVSPHLSGQLRNELSGLQAEAAFEFRGSRKGRMSSELRGR